VATLDALLGDVPADRRARIGLAEAHLLLGDAHAAAGATTAARGAYADARSLLEPLVEASPEIEVRGLWAATLTRTGERDAGVAFADSLRARGYREPGFIRFI